MKTKSRWVASAMIGLASLSSMTYAKPFSDLRFEAGCAAAKKENKIVLIDFFTTWCGPCKRLDRETWTDPKVIDVLETKTISLKMDAEKETKLAERYRIEAYPTVLLLKPDGTEIDRLVGFREPATFITDFDAALTGKDSVARAREAVKSAGTEDAMARMALGGALAQKQQYEEALREYLWCFDHGAEKTPAFAGVRASFLLSAIMTLGQKYPPAREALVKRRDDAENNLLSGSDDKAKVSDFIRLNEVLGQAERNLAVFDKLPQKSAARAQMLDSVFEQLLGTKRYQDALGDADASAIFSREVSQLDTMLQPFKEKPEVKEKIEGFLRRKTIATGSHYFEALAGIHSDEKAQALVDQILAFDSSAKTREELVSCARRAGNPDLEKYVQAK